MLGTIELMILWIILFLSNFIFGLIVKFDKNENKISKNVERLVFLSLFLSSFIILIYTNINISLFNVIINNISFQVVFMYILSTGMYFLFFFKGGKRV